MNLHRLIRGITVFALALAGFWLADAGRPVPLLILLGVAAALYAIRVGEQSEARYGRRVPVTEMLALGRQGDRRMLAGGLAGYLMLACFVAAGWFAFH